jgi:hypothetical protein
VRVVDRSTVRVCVESFTELAVRVLWRVVKVERKIESRKI